MCVHVCVSACVCDVCVCGGGERERELMRARVRRVRTFVCLWVFLSVCRDCVCASMHLSEHVCEWVSFRSNSIKLILIREIKGGGGGGSKHRTRKRCTEVSSCWLRLRWREDMGGGEGGGGSRLHHSSTTLALCAILFLNPVYVVLLYTKNVNAS